MSFAALGLTDELLKAVAEQGYQEPTPIQLAAIPVILQGRDVQALAQTGTGKTAGFTLPLLQKLAAVTYKKPRPVRALVLTPTRELAVQVHDSVRTYGKHVAVFAEAIYGGVSMNSQTQRLRRGCDIVVATPGRLLDHAGQQHIDLSRVEVLVLDEADRMLDMGFSRDIKRILDLLPAPRQNLLFSATFPPAIKTLAGQLLHDPVEIEIAGQTIAADTVSQLVYPIKREYKRELLSYLIGSSNWRQVLVFVRTRHGADRLGEQLLKDGIRTGVLHGDKSQGARSRALASFKAGNIAVLVATDIAARGLDIDQLPHVINFDLPALAAAEDYIHRIGRTGRAGLRGEAISLVCPEEAVQLAAIEKLLQHPIPRVADTGYETVSLDVVPARKIPKILKKSPKKPPEKPLSAKKTRPFGKKPAENKSRRTTGKR
ncbi:MAG: ATP-dependent RNA helicase RhlE [Gammaproteobacteria bacterium HGW-Gammaproteobacteria-3]|nr:MAG: ATP-dependent RNA helicase RhlE [Gammaproteobacteria bacterium HGW-Gammaproteobacteria-3]